MKSPKRIAVLIITGFFAFAPPGTLIFAFMLIAGIVGDVRLVAVGALGLVLLGAAWLLIRRRARKSANAEKMAAAVKHEG